eukprot:scaffold39781_cov45-Cyclotella_meneghiniana.AAC.4
MDSCLGHLQCRDEIRNEGYDWRQCFSCPSSGLVVPRRKVLVSFCVLALTMMDDDTLVHIMFNNTGEGPSHRPRKK